MIHSSSPRDSLNLPTLSLNAHDKPSSLNNINNHHNNHHQNLHIQNIDDIHSNPFGLKNNLDFSQTPLNSSGSTTTFTAALNSTLTSASTAPASASVSTSASVSPSLSLFSFASQSTTQSNTSSPSISSPFFNHSRRSSIASTNTNHKPISRLSSHSTPQSAYNTPSPFSSSSTNSTSSSSTTTTTTINQPISSSSFSNPKRRNSRPSLYLNANTHIHQLSSSTNIQSPTLNSSTPSSPSLIHKMSSNSSFSTDFSFLSANKENFPLSTTNHKIDTSISNNSLTKSYSSNLISPTISRKSSINKHLRKKSSTKLKPSNSNHSRNNSQSSSTFSNFLKNLSKTPTNESKQNNQSHSRSHSYSRSIFNRSNIKSDISGSPIFQINSTRSTTDYCSSDEDLISDNEIDSVDIIRLNQSQNNTNNINNNNNNHFNFNIDIDIDDNDDDIHDDFGSPIQRKKSNSNSNSILNTNTNTNCNNNNQNTNTDKHFRLKRHQSLYNYNLKNLNDSISNPINFDTDQLTSTINELSVSNGMGNSILEDAPFKITHNEDNIPRINVPEFKKILHEFKNKDSLNSNGKFCKYFDDLIIIDCRFKFEFDGGHIDGAINVSSIDELNNIFSPTFNSKINPIDSVKNNRKLIIFHCEFSSHRGPLKAIELRKIDRFVCSDYYPNLYYPEVLILEGGYKEYYESEKNLNRSLSYIEMDHPLFIDERNKNLDLVKKESNIRSSRSSRSNSYVSLSRKSSHGSIKSISSNSILDFSSVNKINYKPTLKQRPSKRSLNNLNVQLFDKSSSNEDENDENDDLQLINSPFENGIFGGLGNQNIDLDCLVEDNNDFADSNSLTTTKSIEQLNISYPFSTNKNDGFKVPLPKQKFDKFSNNLHSRSKTVSSFSYSNHSGYRSAPLLTTPEKSEAKFGNYQFYQQPNDNTSSFLSNFDDSAEIQNLNKDNEYISIYSQRSNQQHYDTPIKDKRNGEFINKR